MVRSRLLWVRVSKASSGTVDSLFGRWRRATIRLQLVTTVGLGPDHHLGSRAGSVPRRPLQAR